MNRKHPATIARLVAAKIMCIVVTYRPLQESRHGHRERALPGDGAELVSPTSGSGDRDQLRSSSASPDGTPIREVTLYTFGHSPGAFACSRSIQSTAPVTSTTRDCYLFAFGDIVVGAADGGSGNID